MKSNLKPNINLDRCNTYSGLAHMYAAISVENRPVLATSIKDTTSLEIPAEMKGGIIVFPQDTDAVLSDIKRIAQKHNPAGWTIGRFFKGCYANKNGEVYSEDSLSVELTGVSDDSLIETAEEYCKAFNPISILIKSYSERNKIVELE